MAAIVVDTSVKAANWTKAKPKDYKGADLDKAIAAWEALAKKAVDAVSKPSTTSISEYGEAIKAAEGIVKYLKSCQDQLDKVAAAVKKTQTELKAQSAKLKGDDKKKYDNAVEAASNIGSGASGIKDSLK